MSEIDDESVDMIFTDPPYGATTKMNMIGNKDLKAFFNALPEMKRILKPDRACLIFCSIPMLQIVLDECSKYFNYKWQLIWYASNNMQCVHWVFPKYTPILWFEKGTTRIIKGKKCQDLRNVPIPSKKIEFVGHPTQKPKYIMKYYIDTFTLENEIVVDNFMGSGTTAVACKELCRHWIGYEVEKKYIKLAEDRLSKAKGQSTNWDKWFQ